MSKPSVTLKHSAAEYDDENTRTILVSSDDDRAVGALIAVQNLPTGILRIDLYRADPEVEVYPPAPEQDDIREPIPPRLYVVVYENDDGETVRKVFDDDRRAGEYAYVLLSGAYASTVRVLACHVTRPAPFVTFTDNEDRRTTLARQFGLEV